MFPSAFQCSAEDARVPSFSSKDGLARLNQPEQPARFMVNMSTNLKPTLSALS